MTEVTCPICGRQLAGRTYSSLRSHTKRHRGLSDRAQALLGIELRQLAGWPPMTLARSRTERPSQIPGAR